MKFFCFFLFPLVFSLTNIYPLRAEASFPQNCLEVDLTSNKIKFTDFSLGKLSINGLFSFRLKKESNLSAHSSFEKRELELSRPDWLWDLEGKDILLGKRRLPWVRLRLVKRKEVIFISYLYSPLFTAKGRVDLKEKEIFLEITGRWQESSSLWEGEAIMQARVWGRLGELFASGTLRIDDGRYKDLEFLHLFLDFFGKVPLVNITDSQITLKDGSVYNVMGLIDLRNLANIAAQTDFISQKIYLGEWELFSPPYVSREMESFGLRKKVNGKFDVLFDTYNGKDAFMDSGAELRYKVSENGFLRLRMQGDRDVIGFEKRAEF